MKCLIDMDIVLFKACFAAQRTSYHVDTPDGQCVVFDYKKGANDYIKDLPEYQVTPVQILAPFEHAALLAKNLINSILEKTCADNYVGYLSGENNFRKHVYPEYKANRKDIARPLHEAKMREYLTHEFNTVVVDDMEADDMLSIVQCTSTTDSTVIATIDKDLDMVPGLHFNWDKDKLYHIDATSAEHNFYVQWIKGDSTDNIPGIYKLSGVKATRKILEPIYAMISPAEMEQYVYEVYENNGVSRDVADTTKNLIWILRTQEELCQIQEKLKVNQSNEEEVSNKDVQSVEVPE